MLELLQMWALMEVLGVIFLPLTITVFHNLPDRGWAFSKAVGLAILAFCVWLPLMCLQFLPFSQIFILCVLLILVALNVFGFLRVRQTVLKVLCTHRVYIVCVELIFLGMVFLLGLLRSYSPEIRNFEMFMDEGFLAAIMRSPHLPPNDMWYAGQPINYYYYAHYTIAMLAKLLGQSPSIAFNTGISLFFGLTAVSLFGVTCNVVAWAAYRHRQSSPLAELPSADRVWTSMKVALPYGVLTILLGLVLGNLAATQTWWINHGDLPSYYWFNASRVIVNTINEFPAFSFLLSCFHAHVLALAFTIVGIALAFNLFLEDHGQGLNAFGRGWRLPLTLGVTALMIGSLYAMNGWDYPTYLALCLVCLVLQQWMAHQQSLNWEMILDAFIACAALGLLSFLLFMPFYLNFVSPAQGLGILNPNDRTPIVDEVLIYGVFAFIFLSFLFINFFRSRYPTAVSGVLAVGTPAMQKDPEMFSDPQKVSPANFSASASVTQARQGESKLTNVSTLQETSEVDEDELALKIESLDDPPVDGSLPDHELVDDQPDFFRNAGLNWRNGRVIGLLAILVAGLLLLVFMKNSLTFVITGSLAAIGALLLLYHLRERERSFVLLLGATACALVAFCEVIFLRDVFVDQVPRMNTVFKFYFQAWALLSIVGGAGVYFVLTSLRPSLKLSLDSRRMYAASRILWSIALLVLLLMGAVYPLTAVSQRTDAFAQRTNSLDGLDYMQSYDPADYAAIRWLNSTISGDPVIVEATGPEYSDYGRVSIFTGLPTIMGWEGHEWQWRVNWVNRGNNSADFFNRVTDITQIYRSISPQVVLSTMARYHAQYLYVGPLEQVTYFGADLQRFGGFMHIVYQEKGVTIYKVL